MCGALGIGCNSSRSQAKQKEYISNTVYPFLVHIAIVHLKINDLSTDSIILLFN